MGAFEIVEQGVYGGWRHIDLVPENGNRPRCLVINSMLPHLLQYRGVTYVRASVVAGIMGGHYTAKIVSGIYRMTRIGYGTGKGADYVPVTTELLDRCLDELAQRSEKLQAELMPLLTELDALK